LKNQKFLFGAMDQSSQIIRTWQISICNGSWRYLGPLRFFKPTHWFSISPCLLDMMLSLKLFLLSKIFSKIKLPIKCTAAISLKNMICTMISNYLKLVKNWQKWTSLRPYLSLLESTASILKTWEMGYKGSLLITFWNLISINLERFVTKLSKKLAFLMKIIQCLSKGKRETQWCISPTTSSERRKMIKNTWVLIELSLSLMETKNASFTYVRSYIPQARSKWPREFSRDTSCKHQISVL